MVAEMGEPESKCPQCEYSFPGYQTAEERMDATPYYCDYISIKGHMRPCSPGAACTVFKPRTHEGHGAWQKKRKDALDEEAQTRQDGKPRQTDATEKKARPPRRGTPRLPAEVVEKARALLIAGEDAKKVADQVGVSRTKVYKIRNELIDQGKMERPELALTQYSVRSIFPKEEVFRGNIEECAAYLGVTKSYIWSTIYKGQVIQQKYMVARVQPDNETKEELSCGTN